MRWGKGGVAAVAGCACASATAVVVSGKVAGVDKVGIEAFGLFLAGLEALEERAFLGEFVAGHFLLDALQDAETQDGADDAGELGAFSHWFGKDGGEGRAKFFRGEVGVIYCLTDAFDCCGESW